MVLQKSDGFSHHKLRTLQFVFSGLGKPGPFLFEVFVDEVPDLFFLVVLK